MSTERIYNRWISSIGAIIFAINGGSGFSGYELYIHAICWAASTEMFFMEYGREPLPSDGINENETYAMIADIGTNGYIHKM